MVAGGFKRFLGAPTPVVPVGLSVTQTFDGLPGAPVGLLCLVPLITSLLPSLHAGIFIFYLLFLNLFFLYSEPIRGGACEFSLLG